MEIPSSTYYYKPKGSLSKKKYDADIAGAIEPLPVIFPHTATGGSQRLLEGRER